MPDGQITSDFPKWCQAPKSKIFLFSFYPNQLHIPRRLVPPEGRSRVVTSAGRDAVDAAVSGDGRAGRKARELTNGTRTNGAVARRSLWRRRVAADCEAVWFWHPLLVLNLRRRVGPTGLGQTFNPQMTVTRRIRRRGEHEISRKPLRAGMPGDFRWTCGD